MNEKKVIVWCAATAGAGTGTNPPVAAYRGRFERRETRMKMARIVLAGAAALIIISSAASAQQALTGTVTKIDRISGTVAIRQTQSGTVGANSTGTAEEYKAQESMLNTLHAGDSVTFSAAETGGIRTITKLEKQ
jgi:Cu/Ag efflux protein CusF